MKKEWFIISLLLCCAVAASEGSTKLLALAETDDSSFGTVASITLNIEPGEERVFIETFPLTKITTQASLRFAQQMACYELGIDCSVYDFFWKINAVRGIVGGPSAGAAAAALASSVLLNKSLPENVAITGTINSGGMIGPVSGIRYKLEAAAKNGIDTVFVPRGLAVDNGTNFTQLSGQLNLTIIEVAELGQVLNYTLGIPYHPTHGEIVLDAHYEALMSEVAQDLCSRSAELMQLVSVAKAINYTKTAGSLMDNGSFYSAASFCFRANVLLRKEVVSDFSPDGIDEAIIVLYDKLEAARNKITNMSLETLNDLQTYMAVMERIDDSEGVLDSINATENTTAGKLAYAEERFFSALAWSRFFHGGGTRIQLDKDSLKKSCISKISEASERFSYVLNILSENLAAAQYDMDRAGEYLSSGNYVMCLYAASKAKSASNFMMDLIGIDRKDLPDIVKLKLNVAGKAIVQSEDKGLFPIMAYSYLEYARSLSSSDDVNALLFAEEALELSNLDMYFHKEPSKVRSQVSPKEPSGFVLGFVLGILAGAVIVYAAFRKRLR